MSPPGRQHAPAHVAPGDRARSPRDAGLHGREPRGGELHGERSPPSLLAALGTAVELRPRGARSLQRAVGNSFVQDRLRAQQVPSGGELQEGGGGEDGGGRQLERARHEGGAPGDKPGESPPGGDPAAKPLPPGGPPTGAPEDAPEGGDGRPDLEANTRVDSRDARPGDPNEGPRAAAPAKEGAGKLLAAGGVLAGAARMATGGGMRAGRRAGGSGPTTAPSPGPTGAGPAVSSGPRGGPSGRPSAGQATSPGKLTPPRFESPDGEREGAPINAEARASAEAATADFLLRNTEAVTNLLDEAQSAPEQIRAATRTAVEAVEAAVAGQREAISSRIAALRSEATAAAASARAAIEGECETTISDLQSAVEEARGAVTDAHGTARSTLEALAGTQRGRVESVYATWDKNYRAMGPTVANRAAILGTQRAAAWRRQKNGESSILDGPIHDNRLDARAEAAEKVAEEYRKGLLHSGDEQAAQAMQGKPADLAFIDTQVQGVGATLDTQLEQALAALDTSLADGTSAAESAREDLTGAVDAQLSGTLAGLTEQEQQQLATLDSAGSSQRQAIEDAGEAACDSVQQGLGAAGATLLASLEAIGASFDGSMIPDPDSLAAALGDAQGEFDGLYQEVRDQLQASADASGQGVADGQAQAIESVTAFGRAAITGAETSAAEFSAKLESLSGQARQGFAQLATSGRASATQARQSATQGYTAATGGIRTLFQTLDGRLEQTFAKGGEALKTGLEGSLAKENADIDKYADQAADQVQPRWKKVLKVLLIIAVIVVVAVVAGPAVIGAVGAMAGALGASAATAAVVGTVVGGAIVGAGAGAVIQMGNNVIDGHALMEGVGKAAVIGAIGGAFGGAGAALGGQVVSTVARYGIQFAADAAGGALGSLATGEPLTLEGVLIGAGIGLAVGAAAQIGGTIKARIRPVAEAPSVRPNVEPNVKPTPGQEWNELAPHPSEGVHGPVKPVEPGVSTKPTEPVVAPKASEPVVAPKASEPVVAPKASEPVISPKASEPAVAPKATKPTPARSENVSPEYHNRSGTQTLHVDPANDAALVRSTDRAFQRIDKGATLDQKLTHLVDHVHSDVPYDQAAQQAMYARGAGRGTLGESIETGAAVCREKAVFTQKLLADMGIESKVVTGNVKVHGPNGEGKYGHAWVELADGTVVDGTWGKVYPAGKGYPVDSVVKSQEFFRPRTALQTDEVEAALKRTAATLDDPRALDALKRASTVKPTLSPADRLLRPGSEVKLPEKAGGLRGLFGGRQKATISRVERDMVVVRGADGKEITYPRSQILKINGVADEVAAGSTNVAKTDVDEGFRPRVDEPVKAQPTGAGTGQVGGYVKDASPLHTNISEGQRLAVVRDVPLSEVVSAPGHQFLRNPAAVEGMAGQLKGTADNGAAMFAKSDPMILNIYTKVEGGVVKVRAIEVLDGNHRFAAGLHAGTWKTLGDIPPSLLQIRVNGFNTNGQQLPRWVPLDVAKKSSIQGWKEVGGPMVKGPTAEIPGDIASVDGVFPKEIQGVGMGKVVDTSLERARTGQ